MTYTIPYPAQAGPRERKRIRMWLPTFNLYTNPGDRELLAVLNAFGAYVPLTNRALAQADRDAEDLFLQAAHSGTSDWFFEKSGGARAATSILLATRFVLGELQPVPASNSGEGKRTPKPPPGQDALLDPEGDDPFRGADL